MKSIVFAIYFLIAIANAQLRFFVVGDWGGQETAPYTTEIQLQVAEQMGIVGSSFIPNFIAGTGDNFYDNGIETDVTDSRFANTFANVYTQTALQTRWYMVLGNHDWIGNVSAQVEYTKHSKLWYLPSIWYSTVIPIPGTSSTAEFVFYDTQIFSDQWGSTLANQQLSWIESTLNSSKADWLFVLGHYPVYSVGGNGPTPLIVEYLLPVLEKYNVDAYINGHEHNMEHVSTNGIEFFTSGAGHKTSHKQDHADDVPPGSLKYFWPPNKTIGDVTGAFMTVILDSQNMAVTFVDDTGNQLYSYNRPKQRFPL